MYISDILKSKKLTVSFEVFPPKKTEMFADVRKAVADLSALKPDFISVTYGAGGGTSAHTADISAEIQNVHNITALSHLTCVASTKAEIENLTANLRSKGIENILAMRGDIPEGVADFPNPKHYRYACELIMQLKSMGGFCIGGACYPEGHVECPSAEQDLINLKNKVDTGCDFLISQLFFDNEKYLDFLDRCTAKGINVPIMAGVMPVQNAKQIKRMCAMSGATLPPKFMRMVERYQDDAPSLLQAGIAYATDQIVDLITAGVHGVHIYTMNKPVIAGTIMKNISGLI
ncbi:MAG: methylenetetrahydrofolate reductase [NAD(P)H] [Oscillospiraceae bacterium]|nr:methylenetetrahydrofolate reductase [NAD(P)H] [Oscillospiraceae bacterium]